MKSAVNRIVNGLGANIFGQLVTVAIQLISVPIFLYYWGAEKYGVWLIISAIPAYFAMADAGFIGVAINRMAILAAQGNYRLANVVFQSALVFFSAISTVVIFFSFSFCLLVDVESIIGRGNKTPLLALVLVAILSLFSSFFDAVSRSGEKYHFGVYVVNFLRILEWGGGVLFLLVFGGMESVAFGMLIFRMMGTVICLLVIKKKFPLFKWGVSHFSISEIREMSPQALAFLGFPLGNVLSLQGSVIILGLLMGPLFVAQYTTLRTLARLLTQMITTFGRSLWPELSRAWGGSNYHLVRTLYIKGTFISIAISTIFVFPIYFFSELILELWTHGGVSPNSELLMLLLASTFVSGGGQLAQVGLLATNSHVKMGYYYFIFMGFGLLAGYLTFPLLGWISIPLSLLGADIGIVICAHRQFSELIRVSV